MTKQDQFLLLVQTTVLADVINRAGTENPRRSESILGLMDSALGASAHIPADEPVGESAVQFCSWLLDEGYPRPEWLPRR